MRISAAGVPWWKKYVSWCPEGLVFLRAVEVDTFKTFLMAEKSRTEERYHSFEPGGQGRT